MRQTRTMVGAPAVSPLEGIVIVLAAPSDAGGAGEMRATAVDMGAALVRAGGRLAVVTPDAAVIDALSVLAEEGAGAPVGWRADPADPETWERLTAHIEQRVGPIDAAIADPVALDVVRIALEPDLRRRGHGDVIALMRWADPVSALNRRLGRTR
jgi:hypothetical protein